MAAFERPWAMSESTSRSRRVSVARESALRLAPRIWRTTSGSRTGPPCTTREMASMNSLTSATWKSSRNRDSTASGPAPASSGKLSITAFAGDHCPLARTHDHAEAALMRRDTPGTPDQDPQNSRTSATQVKRQAKECGDPRRLCEQVAAHSPGGSRCRHFGGTLMTTVRIAHAEPQPGKLGHGGFHPRGFLVVLADDAGHRALPIWLQGEPGQGDLGQLVEFAARPAEIVTAGAPEELAAWRLRAAGATVTGVD